MKTNNNYFFYQNYESIAVSFSTYCTRCKQLALTVFNQMHCLALQIVKTLKDYVWKRFHPPSTTSQIISSQRDISFFNGHHYLNLDVMNHVFSYLSAKNIQNLLMTHKAHLKLLNEPMVLNRLFSKSTVNPLKLASLEGSLTHRATELNLSKMGWKPKNLITFIQKFSNLASLDLSRCERLTDQTICTLAPYISHLTSLDLSRCDSITDLAIEAIAQSCSKLELLNLAWGPRITDAAIQAIARQCPNLSSLDLSAEGLNITDAAILELVQHCPKLTHLSLRGAQITDRSLQALAELHLPLKSLYLTWCPNLTSASILELIQHCHGLERLGLDGNQITDQILQSVADHSPNLTGLCLGYRTQLTDRGLQAIAQKCSHMTLMTLAGCKNLTPTSLEELSRGCSHLKELFIVDSGIKDIDIQSFAGHWPHLESLWLGTYQDDTDATIRNLAQRYPKLKELFIKGPKVTDTVIQAIAESYPHLETLDISHGEQVTDNAIQFLAQRCPRLRNLDLTGCSQITDHAIGTLAQSCRQLKRLNLTGCSQITDNAMQFLEQYSLKLKELKLQGCHNITNAAILHAMIQSHPRLQIDGLFNLIHEWYYAADWYHANRPQPWGCGPLLKLISRVVSYYRLNLK